MFKKGILSVLIVFLVMMMSSSCFADAKTGGNPVDKLVVGLINIVTGWAELPLSIFDVIQKDQVNSIVNEGILKGTYEALRKTGAGIADTVTFLFPPYDQPLVEPFKLFSKE